MSVTLSSTGITYSSGNNQSTKNANYFSNSGTTNGYVKFPSGMILQWGQSTNGSTITFPIAFPNAVWSVVAVGTSGSSGRDVRVINVSTSKFDCGGDVCCVNVIVTTNWMATGY